MTEKPIGELSEDPEDCAGTAGWAKLLCGSWSQAVDRGSLLTWADRMADLLSPAMADHLLGAGPVEGRLVDPQRSAKGRL